MNQRVIEEASKIVELPSNIVVWEIIDIGEGHRTDKSSRESYEEEIYTEIIQRVNELFQINT